MTTLDWLLLIWACSAFHAHKTIAALQNTVMSANPKTRANRLARRWNNYFVFLGVLFFALLIARGFSL